MIGVFFLKNSDDVEFVKILRNETHLSFGKGVVPGHNSQGDEKNVGLKRKSLSLRITVEVEMASQ